MGAENRGAPPDQRLLYDVIAVGARCAGASTALLLARKAHRMLLVDRSTFVSRSPAA